MSHILIPDRWGEVRRQGSRCKFKLPVTVLENPWSDYGIDCVGFEIFSGPLKMPKLRKAVSQFQPSSPRLGDIGSIPAGCSNSLLPFRGWSHFAWHWASQRTDMHAFILLHSTFFFFTDSDFVSGNLTRTGLTWTASDFHCFWAHCPDSEGSALSHCAQPSGQCARVPWFKLARSSSPVAWVSAGPLAQTDLPGRLLSHCCGWHSSPPALLPMKLLCLINSKCPWIHVWIHSTPYSYIKLEGNPCICIWIHIHMNL